ncbi:hypothetical protein HDU98_007794 [Podochytrium sp. JEL0797]|nr:hypothetical protein HDU98_007794 [Podochytrium sp. JEL0797]
MTPRYNLLALDLDGTTLNGDGIVTARTQAALAKVASTGTLIALCSGRSTCTMEPTATSLGLPVHILSYNGAMALDAERNSLFATTMTHEQVDHVLDAAKHLGRTVNFYDTQAIHAIAETDEHKALIERYRILTGATYHIINDYRTLTHLPPKLLILGNDAKQITAHLETHTTNLKLISDDFFVECLPLGVNKGAGFVRMCQALEIPLANTVAFGDGWNDLEFLENAGLGVAMKNARKELQERADKVTAFSNKEDGLAIELEMMLEQGLFGAKVEE